MVGVRRVCCYNNFGNEVWVEKGPTPRGRWFDSNIHSSKILWTYKHMQVAKQSPYLRRDSWVALATPRPLVCKRSKVTFNADHKFYTPAFIDPTEKVAFAPLRRLWQAPMKECESSFSKKSRKINLKRILYNAIHLVRPQAELTLLLCLQRTLQRLLQSTPFPRISMWLTQFTRKTLPPADRKTLSKNLSNNSDASIEEHLA